MEVFCEKVHFWGWICPRTLLGTFFCPHSSTFHRLPRHTTFSVAMSVSLCPDYHPQHQPLFKKKMSSHFWGWICLDTLKGTFAHIPSATKKKNLSSSYLVCVLTTHSTPPFTETTSIFADSLFLIDFNRNPVFKTPLLGPDLSRHPLR